MFHSGLHPPITILEWAFRSEASVQCKSAGYTVPQTPEGLDQSLLSGWLWWLGSSSRILRVSSCGIYMILLREVTGRVPEYIDSCAYFELYMSLTGHLCQWHEASSCMLSGRSCWHPYILIGPFQTVIPASIAVHRMLVVSQDPCANIPT